MISGDTKPFHEVIRQICGRRVIPFDRTSSPDIVLIDALDGIAAKIAAEVNRNPIVRQRPNEAGNAVEIPTREAFRSSDRFDLVAMSQSTGYPDIQVRTTAGDIVYVECKTHRDATYASRLRSFYFSPSRTFKVTRDGYHVAMSFGLRGTPTSDGRISFTCFRYELVDLFDLPCRLKTEWNASNADLYGGARTLSSGEVSPD